MAAGTVHRDLSQVSRVFSGWRALPFPWVDQSCLDLQGRYWTARAGGKYVYPEHQNYRNTPFPYNEADLAVEYRSPANAGRDLAGFAKPAMLRCMHAEMETSMHKAYGASGAALCCHVRVTAGLPRSLVRALGKQAEGYRVTAIAPDGSAHQYGLLFAYADPRDQHVTYHVGLWVGNSTGEPDAKAERVLEQRALRVVGATR